MSFAWVDGKWTRCDMPLAHKKSTEKVFAFNAKVKKGQIQGRARDHVSRT